MLLASYVGAETPRSHSIENHVSDFVASPVYFHPKRLPFQRERATAESQQNATASGRLSSTGSRRALLLIGALAAALAIVFVTARCYNAIESGQPFTMSTRRLAEGKPEDCRVSEKRS